MNYNEIKESYQNIIKENVERLDKIDTLENMPYFMDPEVEGYPWWSDWKEQLASLESERDELADKFNESKSDEDYENYKKVMDSIDELKRNINENVIEYKEKNKERTGEILSSTIEDLRREKTKRLEEIDSEIKRLTDRRDTLLRDKDQLKEAYHGDDYDKFFYDKINELIARINELDDERKLLMQLEEELDIEAILGRISKNPEQGQENPEEDPEKDPEEDPEKDPEEDPEKDPEETKEPNKNQERIDYLREKIKQWQNELDTIWKDKNTDAAEVERRNLKNLIMNAEREIEELEKSKNKDTEQANNANHEYIRYFHGQGDLVENNDDDRRANDEYFGFYNPGRLDPKPNPEPVPDPKPDPEPVPDPKPDPEPVPDPKPDPEPVPDPKPDPEPVPDPTPEPDTKLPLKSGLQVYRKVLNDVGYIKGTKAITAHDWLYKFGLVGKAAAAGIRFFTGRKKEIARIEDVLDELSEEDLILMMDDYITKDNNTRTIISDKHNDIFLRALKNKLSRYREEKEPEYREKELSLNDRIEALTEERESATPERQAQIDYLLAVIGGAKNAILKKRIALGDRIDTVERGRDEKSLDKKDNIVGKTRANRNPDNREEINELADIELRKLEALARGDKRGSAIASYEMEKYRDSKTEYTYTIRGKRKASIGAFEAPMGEVKIISQRKYIAPEVLHAVSLATGIAVAQLVNLMGQEEVINQGIEAFNNSNGQTITEIEGTITESSIETAQESLNADALGVQLGGERASEFVGNFAEQSAAYQASDANLVGLSDQAISEVQGFTPTSSDSLGRLSEIFAKKAEIAGTYGDQVASELESAATGYYSDASHLFSSAGVDHTLTSALEQSAQGINQSQAETFGMLSEVFGKLSNLSPAEMSKIDLDLKPILLTLIPTASRTAQTVIDERGKKVSEPVVEEPTEEEITEEEAEID